MPSGQAENERLLERIVRDFDRNPITLGTELFVGGAFIVVGSLLFLLVGAVNEFFLTKRAYEVQSNATSINWPVTVEEPLSRAKLDAFETVIEQQTKLRERYITLRKRAAEVSLDTTISFQTEGLIADQTVTLPYDSDSIEQFAREVLETEQWQPTAEELMDRAARVGWQIELVPPYDLEHLETLKLSVAETEKYAPVVELIRSTLPYAQNHHLLASKEDGGLLHRTEPPLSAPYSKRQIVLYLSLLDRSESPAEYNDLVQQVQQQLLARESGAKKVEIVDTNTKQ